MQIYRFVLFAICLTWFAGSVLSDKGDVPPPDDDGEIEVESDTEVPEEKVKPIN